MSAMDGRTPAHAPAPSGDGLLTWLVGGLLVGLVVLGGVLIAYKVGYDNGRDSAPAAPAATQPVETQPTETQPQPPDGASVFASAGCAACHTLSAAGASGTVGPNLDELRPTQAQVVSIVTSGRGVMPSFADQLSPEEIQAVASYVSGAAGG
jgi:mono/diheme cytochrome c family protein